MAPAGPGRVPAPDEEQPGRRPSTATSAPARPNCPATWPPSQRERSSSKGTSRRSPSTIAPPPVSPLALPCRTYHTSPRVRRRTSGGGEVGHRHSRPAQRRRGRGSGPAEEQGHRRAGAWRACGPAPGEERRARSAPRRRRRRGRCGGWPAPGRPAARPAAASAPPARAGGAARQRTRAIQKARTRARCRVKTSASTASVHRRGMAPTATAHTAGGATDPSRAAAPGVRSRGQHPAEGDGHAPQDGGEEVDPPGDVSREGEQRGPLGQQEVEGVAGGMGDPQQVGHDLELARVATPDGGGRLAGVEGPGQESDQEGDGPPGAHARATLPRPPGYR